MRLHIWWQYLCLINLFARYWQWKCAWSLPWPLECINIKCHYANRKTTYNVPFVCNNNAFPICHIFIVCEIFMYELLIVLDSNPCLENEINDVDELNEKKCTNLLCRHAYVRFRNLTNFNYESDFAWWIQ